MKCSILFCAFFFALVTARAEDVVPPTDDALVQFVQQRTNAVRITEKPFQMEQFVSFRCAGPTPEESRVTQKEKSLGISDPHLQKYVHVYVSTNGVDAMKARDGVFPQGAIVLKEKFSDATGTNTEFFTGMVKRQPGYNPDCGDWEFFTMPGDASTISKRGKLSDCMECHVEYKNRDFVTKLYAGIRFYPQPPLPIK